MSTSPDAPKGENFAIQSAGAIHSTWTSRNPGLTLLKGIFWLALVVGALVAMGMNYEIVWDVWVGTVIPGLETLLEVGEKLLDSFFLLVGVGAAFAPMATAYTGFVLLLGLIYLLWRQAVKINKTTQAKKQELSQIYSEAWNAWYGNVKATAQEKWTAWWNSLTVTDKVIAGTFIVLIVIPIALLLSFILGSLVADLF